MKKLNKLPKFKNITEEADFWQTHDSVEFVNWAEAKLATFPNLKPSTKTISLRLPENLLNDIKVLANKKDIPYQSLIKVLLSHGIHAFQKAA